MENLSTKISDIKGIGPKTVDKFDAANIRTIKDLLFYFPRKYDDYTTITTIKDLASRVRNNDVLTVRGTVLAIANKKTRRRGFTVTEAQIVDDTGVLKVVWFNQPYLAKMLKDRTVILNGKVAFDRFSNSFVMESPARANVPKIMPVYSQMGGISSYFYQKLIQKFLPLIESVDEYLPPEILTDNNLPNIQQALVKIHNPKNSDELDLARRRFAFEELFLIALNANIVNKKIKSFSAPEIGEHIELLKEMISTLPFTLTNDQKKSLWQIIEDIKKNTPMNRLLNGDVGSGKTVVAALASYLVVKSGYKVVIMCPTEILAAQHFKTFSEIFRSHALGIGLYTSNRKEFSNSQFLISNQCQNSNDKCLNINNLDLNKNLELRIKNLNLANCQIIIGTHALLHVKEEILNIGLVVVDEQHRFGVKQRAAIAEISTQCSNDKCINDQMNDKCEMENGKYQKVRPHFLSMTATPIPRTLNLALFGNLDLSVIKEKPADRKEIKTRLVEEDNRQKAYDFIRKQINVGRQAFIICPLIEEKIVENESKEGAEEYQVQNIFDREKKTVVAEFEKLKDIYPECKIAMLHGKLPAREKEQIMSEFASGETKILVSTSVVEVGVDISNASVMMIEDADRFGLAQVHQFRGRVGRGEHQSFCFLFTNSFNPKTIERLRALENTNDGFELAEIDLELRGPGAIFGSEQSGMLDLKWASLSDRVLMEEASIAAREFLPKIKGYPELGKKLLEFNSSNHFE